MIRLSRRIKHVHKVRYFTTDNDTPVTNSLNKEDTFSIEQLSVSKVMLSLSFFSNVNYK